MKRQIIIWGYFVLFHVYYHRIVLNMRGTKLSWFYHIIGIRGKSFAVVPCYQYKLHCYTHKKHSRISNRLQKPWKFCPLDILYYTVFIFLISVVITTLSMCTYCRYNLRYVLCSGMILSAIMVSCTYSLITSCDVTLSQGVHIWMCWQVGRCILCLLLWCGMGTEW